MFADMDDRSPLPRLLGNDPKNLLSTEARYRLEDAYWDAEKIRKRAVADLLAQLKNSPENIGVSFGDYVSAGEPALTWRRAMMEFALVSFRAELAEFRALGLPRKQLWEIMQAEAEAACYSLELSKTDGELLLMEVDLYKSNLAASRSDSVEVEVRFQAVPFGERLRQLRESKSWTIDALAAEARVSRDSIMDYEAGKTTPRPKTLIALSTALGVPKESLD